MAMGRTSFELDRTRCDVRRLFQALEVVYTQKLLQRYLRQYPLVQDDAIQHYSFDTLCMLL